MVARSWPALLVAGFRPPQQRLDAPADADLVHAALTDFAVAAIDEPSDDSLRAYFHDTFERDRALAALRAIFPALALTAVDIPDDDWAARSQANLKAIRVGRIIVAPPWEVNRDAEIPLKPDTPADGEVRLTSDTTKDTTIVIQPSMGFGTGHHATTRMCLAALQRVDVQDRAVIDVGTGSGVLAIAASRLGASPVIALDDDPDAIQSAGENLELNPEARVDLRLVDLRDAVPGIAHVVLANLTGTLLMQAAGQLQAMVAPRGRLIVSGLLDREEAGVVAAFSGLAVVDRTQEDEWVCLVLTSHHQFE